MLVALAVAVEVEAPLYYNICAVLCGWRSEKIEIIWVVEDLLYMP